MTSKNPPKVSVIMSVYNGIKFLDKAIRSILDQSFSDLELIIVNDGSTDDSLDLIKKYVKLDSRVVLINNDSNQGLTKSLNHALKVARGEYIARMDSDDIAFPDRISLQAEYMDHNNVDILGTFAYDIDERGEIIRERRAPTGPGNVRRLLPFLNPLAHPTVMMRRTSLDLLGGYDERYKTSQDYDLWFRAAKKNLILDNIGEFLLYYRMAPDYTIRKSFKYRFNEFRIRQRGCRGLGGSPLRYFGVFIPLILAVAPKAMFGWLKQMDPRSK